MIVDGCTDFGEKIIPSRFEKDEVKKVNWDLRLALVQPNANMKHNLLARDFPVFKILFFRKISSYRDWFDVKQIGINSKAFYTQSLHFSKLCVFLS